MPGLDRRAGMPLSRGRPSAQPEPFASVLSVTAVAIDRPSRNPAPAMTGSAALSPDQPGSMLAALTWIESTLTGTVGTSLAVLAVGWFGLALLSGQASLRRGAMVVIGCFILFGAPSLARGLMGLAGNARNASAAAPQASLITAPPPAPAMPPDFDPYAGAAVPRGQ